MDLKQLEYFVHVAEMGSFTRVAALLDVAQPALSRQVRLLEVELRQPLLDRNGRRHAMVMMVNHPEAPNSAAAQDALMDWLWAEAP